MITCVYLCVKNKNKFSYECKKFQNYEKAMQVYRDFYDKREVTSSTMIPICNFNPFYKLLLWYKLSKIFIKIKEN
jgi:hypothetical protein